ncbi:TlpA family protein disulfide reductase [Mariniblastus sp.]|nr:TlpA family protein disulfide reductase [Mariniblastus sp.]
MNQKLCVAAMTMLAVGLTFVAQLQAQNQPKPGIIGQAAPKWSVSQWHQLPSGKESIDVDDFSGKVTYLYFFQSWCPGCHREGFPTLQALSKKFKDDPEVAFVAIQTTFEGHNVNTADKLKEMATRYELKIPFGQSKGDAGTPEIMQKYRTGGTPWVVIIDRQGVVRFNGFHISPADAAAGIEQLKAETQKVR